MKEIEYWRYSKTGCLLYIFLCIIGVIALLMALGAFVSGFVVAGVVISLFGIGVFLGLRRLKNKKVKIKKETESSPSSEAAPKTEASATAQNQVKTTQDKSWETKLGEMDGYEFEKFVAELFDKMGYDTKVTKKSGDLGVDVIAENPFETLAIQAKNYRNKVSNSAVQEIVAAKNPSEADKAIVVTTSEFTNSAKNLAEANKVRLVNRQELLNMIDEYM